MSEWWTYRPADFLMFSPRTYGRLFELVSEAWWPLHLLVLPVGLLGLLVLAGVRADRQADGRRGGQQAVAADGRAWALACRRATRRALSWMGPGLGLAWLLCTLVFVQGRYLPVNWAVAYLLPGLWLLVPLLPLLAWRAAAAATDADPEAAAAAPGARARAMALLLGTWALLLHPLLAPLSGHGWRQAEVMALAPDPTAIATLAWLLLLPPQAGFGRRARFLVWLTWLAWLPVLGWCLFSGFMLATMERWQALVPLLAAAAALWARRPARR